MFRVPSSSMPRTVGHSSNSPTLDGCCAAAAPQRLEWTADAGSAWVNITPPAARGATVIGVDFSTDADGWAVIAGDPNLPPLIAHTEELGACVDGQAPSTGASRVRKLRQRRNCLQ